MREYMSRRRTASVQASPDLESVATNLDEMTSAVAHHDFGRIAVSPDAAFSHATSGQERQIPYREDMERAFSRDFDHVRAYMGDATAQEGLDALGAQAAASGNAVAFETAHPSPELVAHELTHVVQDEISRDGQTPGSGVHASEIEARVVASRVAGGGIAGPILSHSPGIHLQERPDYPSPNPTPSIPGQLNRPSYVAGPTTGSSGGVGSTPYAAGRDDTVLPAIGKLYAAAKSWESLGTSLAQGKYEGDDSVKNCAVMIHGFASSLVNMAKSLDGLWVAAKEAENSAEWRNTPEYEKQANSKSLDRAGNVLLAADFIIHTVNTIDKLGKLDHATVAMKDKTNLKTVEDWADGVVGTFDALSGFPIPLIPGFMAEYYKGLLGAPKAYVGAFKSIMKARYGQLDKEIGLGEQIFGRNQRARNLGMNTIDWEGPLSDVFISAYFVPETRENGDNLQAYMTRNRKIAGQDLYDAQKSWGVALLIRQIEADLTSEKEQTTKLAWIRHLGKYA
jgi:hypothetical protein